MRKPLWNLITDFLLLTLFVSMLSTGLIMEFILPRGEGGARFRGGDESARTLMGLGRHDWGEIHAMLSWALIILIITHLALHWKWIVAMVKERLGSRIDRGQVTNSLGPSIRRVMLFLYVTILFAILVLPWLMAN